MDFLSALPGAVTNPLFDLLCVLPAMLGEDAALVWVAVVLGVAMVLVFRALVDRPRLDGAQAALRAALLEMWLFRHDPWVVLGAEKALVRANLRYLGALALPLAAASLVAAPLLLQSQARWGLQPPAPGAAVLVAAELEPGADLELDLEWEQGEGAISPALRQPRLRRVVWRVTPSRPGALQLRLSGGAGAQNLALQVGPARGPVAAGFSKDPLERLLAPRVSGLPPGSAFRRIAVGYEAAPSRWLWWLSLASLGAAWMTNILVDALRPRRV